jgi:hypothetical protein
MSFKSIPKICLIKFMLYWHCVYLLIGDCLFTLVHNVQGFVQVGDFEFRLLVNVSQMYRFKLMFYSFAQ